MKTAIGIDPGQDGAIVALTEDHGEIVSMGYYLLRDCLKGKRLDTEEVRIALRFLLCPHIVVIERYGARPRQSGSATGAINWGILWAVVNREKASSAILEPAASSWTKILRDQPGEGKARSIAYASARVPTLDLVPPRCRRPHDGIADACCLALYGLDHLKGNHRV
jgi:crossover junction endodeoxyribonuclease RuvC